MHLCKTAESGEGCRHAGVKKGFHINVFTMQVQVKLEAKIKNKKNHHTHYFDFQPCHIVVLL